MLEFRSLELPGCVNLRDFGGHPTRRGGRVELGRLFRGAELGAIDGDTSRRLFEFLGIRRLVDQRMNEEIRDAETALPPSCERVHLPLFTTILPQWREPFDCTPESTSRRYFEMMREGRQTLARIVDLLAAAPPAPTLIHCAAGRDRTGMVVVCVLDLLDVLDESIAADYALSSVVDDEEGRNANPENILCFLARIRAEYGSTREMLLESGLSGDTIDRLRTAYAVALLPR
jgi:protein-tyrosine phosphatase